MVTGRDPLVTASLLSSWLGEPDRPTVLDVRWGPSGPTPVERFRAGHLPGAVRVDLDTDLAAPPGSGGRHPLPDPAAFEAAMRRLGVREGRPVVVYDDANGMIAARLWWLLRYFGHHDVHLLDGGFAAWAEAGLAVHTGDGEPVEPGDVTVSAGGMPVVTAAEVPDVARGGVLLDARAAERYRGEVEPLDPVAGHIPGAVSAPTTDNVDDHGRFRPTAELRDRFAGLGVRAGAPVAAYCGSGVTAAHEVLALHLAGVTAALYVGSWSEWITDPARPVARGGD